MPSASDMRYCHLGGRLVNAHGAIPLAPFDFVPPPPGPDIGCSAMVCADCGKALASWPRHVPIREFSLAEGRTLHARLQAASREPLELQVPGLQADAVYRVWVCGCGVVVPVSRGRFAADAGADDMGRAIPQAWRCAGHPRLDPMVPLDGVVLPQTVVEAAALVVALAHGTEVPAMPEWLNDRPDAWLVRLLHLVEGQTTLQTLAHGLFHALLLDDGPVVHLAASTLATWRRPPGNDPGTDEALGNAIRSLTGAEAALGWRARRESALDWLMLAVANRLSEGATRLEDAAWHMCHWTSKRRPQLLGALAGLRPDVFIVRPECVGPLGRAEFIAMLVGIVTHADVAKARAFVTAVRNLGKFADETIDDIVRVNTPGIC